MTQARPSSDDDPDTAGFQRRLRAAGLEPPTADLALAVLAMRRIEAMLEDLHARRPAAVPPAQTA